jgi:hypothetical protein
LGDQNIAASLVDRGATLQADTLVKVFAVAISSIEYLAVGSSRTLSAIVKPVAPTGSTYQWGINNTTARFLVNGVEYTTASGQTVTIVGKNPSTALYDTIVSVNLLTPPDTQGRTAAVTDTDSFTVFRVTVSGQTDVEVNWDDDNQNDRSDRRDSGVPHQSAKVVYQDGDIQPIQLRIEPEDITTGTTILRVEGEDPTSCAAIWTRNNRSEDRITSRTYDNDKLTTYVYHEAIYPNTLDASGTITGKVILRLESTLDGSKSESKLEIRQRLDAINTYYTTPDEVEYGGSTESLTVSVYGTQTTTTVIVRAVFRMDVEEEGWGRMVNAPPGYPNHCYLGYLSQWVIHTAALTALGQRTAQSTAKWHQSGITAVSALDLPSNIYVPQLWEMVDAVDQSKPQYDLQWLYDYISENRQVDDTGPGKQNPPYPKQKWMDVYIPYVPTVQRHPTCQNMTMVEVLRILGTNHDIKIRWVEQ